MSDSPGMDISQQKRTWHNFTRLILGAVIATVTLLAGMAIFLL